VLELGTSLSQPVRPLTNFRLPEHGPFNRSYTVQSPNYLESILAELILDSTAVKLHLYEGIEVWWMFAVRALSFGSDSWYLHPVQVGSRNRITKLNYLLISTT